MKKNKVTAGFTMRSLKHLSRQDTYLQNKVLFLQLDEGESYNRLEKSPRTFLLVVSVASICCRA